MTVYWIPKGSRWGKPWNYRWHTVIDCPKLLACLHPREMRRLDKGTPEEAYAAGCAYVCKCCGGRKP